MRPPSRGTVCPSFAGTVCHPLQSEGAGNAGGALHPRSRVQDCAKKRTRAYRFSGGTPAFPARWLYGLWRALPGDEFVLSPSSANWRSCRTRLGQQNLRRLDTSNGCQNHTLLPYAATRLRQKASPGIGAVVLREGYRSRDNPPCDSLARPTLPRPPHPAPRP